VSQFTIAVSADEWRTVSDWLWRSLNPDENAAEGHLILECDGTQRTWMATDGTQLVVYRSEGLPVHGLATSDETLRVAINPRLLRWREPQDGVLVVTGEPGRRVVRLSAGTVEAELPEHPGPFCDWRALTANAVGPRARVDTDQLRDALCAAATPPLATRVSTAAVAEVSLAEGRLSIATPWGSGPESRVRLVVDGNGQAPTGCYDLRRLRTLLEPVVLPSVDLLMPGDEHGSLVLKAGDYEAVLAPFDPLADERTHLEDVLRELLNVARPHRDSDGDYPIELSSDVRAYVTLFSDGTPAARIFSVVAAGVGSGDEVDRELNAINSQSAFVKLVRIDDVILARVDLLAGYLDRQQLDIALQSVRQATDRYRTLVAAFFAGSGELEDPHP
jgi:hypothetical protein